MHAPRKRGRPTRPRGSVYWHAASERWCAQTPPDRRGRRRSKYFATEAAAWAWLDTQIDALDDGRNIFAGTEKLGDYLLRWVERCANDADRDWAPSTERTYRWAIGHVDLIQTLTLEDLKRQHIDELLASLSKGGLGRRSVAVVKTMLRSAFNDLVDDDIITRSPVRPGIKRRRGDEERPKIPSWTEQDVRKLLRAAQEHSPHPAMWFLALTIGLRNGQLRSIERVDLDMARRELHVKGTADSTGKMLRRPKNKLGHRVYLEDNVLAALRDHLSQPAPINGRLFTNADGSPMHEQATNSELRDLCRLAKVSAEHRVHDCRHWAASAMLMNGYPLQLTAAILGHENPTTTLSTYAHVLPAKHLDRPRLMSDILPWQTPRVAQHPAPAVHPAVILPPPSLVQPASPLSSGYQNVLEAPPRPDEQIEQPRAESAEDAG